MYENVLSYNPKATIQGVPGWFRKGYSKSLAGGGVILIPGLYGIFSTEIPFWRNLNLCLIPVFLKVDT
jgi:hypothetical protein